MKRPSLSLCMIARNEEQLIAPALRSAKPYVDEMVVVDTGSSDHTPDLARELGARLFTFPWCDSFAAARNESIRHAKSDWILVIDADDRLLPVGGETMRRAIARSKEHGYAFLIEECNSDGSIQDRRVSSVRLFRNQRDIRYHGRVHEEVRLGDDRRLGRWSGLGHTALVQHYGNDPSIRLPRTKSERNERLLRMELSDRPNDPHLWWLMVRLCIGAGRYDEAMAWAMRCRLADKNEDALMPSEREYLVQIERLPAR